MASIGHVAVGLAVARAWAEPCASPRKVWGAMIAYAALALLPDADVIGFRFGVAYGAPWGHRGASHSMVFAFVLTLVASVAAWRSRLPPARTFAAVMIAVGSHGLLDALTDGGLGAALLWPFSTDRFFAPVTPLPVAPIGAGMLSARGLYVVLVEAIVFAPLLVYAFFPRRQRALEAVPGADP